MAEFSACRRECRWRVLDRAPQIAEAQCAPEAAVPVRSQISMPSPFARKPLREQVEPGAETERGTVNLSPNEPTKNDELVINSIRRMPRLRGLYEHSTIHHRRRRRNVSALGQSWPGDTVVLSVIVQPLRAARKLHAINQSHHKRVMVGMDLLVAVITVAKGPGRRIGS